MIKNLRNESIEEAVYVGRYSSRYGQSPLANPFKTDDHTVEGHSIVVEQYRQWLWARIQAGDNAVIRELRKLRKQYQNDGELKLACWCWPLPCHAEVIFNCIEAVIEEKFEL